MPILPKTQHTSRIQASHGLIPVARKPHVSKRGAFAFLGEKQMNTCALCATPFEYVNNGPGRKRKYCSQSCRKKASRKPSPKPCTVAGCNNRHLARGLCSTHYNQQYQPDRHARVDVPCTYCGTMTTTGKSNSKKRRPVCSDYCKSALRFPPKS